MGATIQDGSGGRRFILSCDICATTLTADSLEGRDALRYAAGWNRPAGRRDFCPECIARPGVPALGRSILVA